MNFLARNAARATVRAIPRGSRRFAADATGGDYFAKRQALNNFSYLTYIAKASTELWRKISYYVAFPSIVLCMAWVYNVEHEHHAHEEHEKELHGGKLPEPPAYEYLNRRVKPFPWGNNSLFFKAEVRRRSV
ncbi:COX6A, subunit VIa of cytochrome c oxidase [Pisolithus orientalis]|uniref:COX6A, subunit VIa of cytochrome c oxidase n=1 Tax=Pisolithus orientalis TaxID=936130 RepID=UPI0022252178|nr:COX6A, subunit VIa of cytochrome c oxidase [Pisolithus orientalis]KAI6008272.1 COX6A, subunit VIa of cytochrome c oxidase [Pisolithus orientalis]